MRPRTVDALVDRLADFEVLVEVGIGRRTALAAALAEGGREVRATDVVEHEVPDRVSFHVDDVTAPEPTVYAGADALYALNLPPELHRPAAALAREQGAAFAFTTLGGDAPEVDVRPETLPDETLFWASGPGPDQGER